MQPNFQTAAVLVVVFALFFWAQHDDARSEAGVAMATATQAGRQEAEAIASRDWAARHVCKGQAFEWDGDVLTCFREQP